MWTVAADFPPSGSTHSRTPADRVHETRCPTAANLPPRLKNCGMVGQRFHKAAATIAPQPLARSTGDPVFKADRRRHNVRLGTQIGKNVTTGRLGTAEVFENNQALTAAKALARPFHP